MRTATRGLSKRESRKRLLRAIAAFLALPGVVAFLAPLALAWPLLRDGAPFRLLALVPLVGGIALLLWCTRLFLHVGEGTLAPWNPPRGLVTSGPYRHSRNPMYIAVALILVGWAFGFASTVLWVYALVVMVAFHLRVRLREERWLSETHYSEWPRYAASTPRWLFRSWRARAITAAVIVCLAAFAGLIYEAYAEGAAERAYQPPGMLIDIGGRQFHVLCIGRGEPTVVFEASGFGNSLSSPRVRERVAARARVCSYDRSGMGWSTPGPSEVTPDDLARDLAVLQDQAKFGSSIVLVASSIGGLSAEMFARRYPERISGLVLVDAATSEVTPAMAPYFATGRRSACAAAAAARFGLVRLADPFRLAEDDSDGARRAAAMTYGPQPWSAVCALLRGLSDQPEVFRGAPPLPGTLPMVVLSAAEDGDLFPGSSWVSQEVRAERVASHQRMAKLSSKGVWQQVPESTHLIGESQPDDVAEAVMAVLDALALGGQVSLPPPRDRK